MKKNMEKISCIGNGGAYDDLCRGLQQFYSGFDGYVG